MQLKQEFLSKHFKKKKKFPRVRSAIKWLLLPAESTPCFDLFYFPGCWSEFLRSRALRIALLSVASRYHQPPFHLVFTASKSKHQKCHSETVEGKQSIFPRVSKFCLVKCTCLHSCCQKWHLKCLQRVQNGAKISSSLLDSKKRNQLVFKAYQYAVGQDSRS